MYDWKLAIVTNYRWRQAADDLDLERLYPMRAPKVAASAEAIAQAERETGFDFSQDYRDFLRHADGWPSFLQGVDLFGTRDFLSGEAHRLLMRNEGAVDFMRRLGLGPGDYIAVGADRDDLDLILLVSAKSRELPGAVILYGPEELDRFQSFCEFFSSMIETNRWLAEQAQADRAGH